MVHPAASRCDRHPRHGCCRLAGVVDHRTTGTEARTGKAAIACRTDRLRTAEGDAGGCGGSCAEPACTSATVFRAATTTGPAVLHVREEGGTVTARGLHVRRQWPVHARLYETQGSPAPPAPDPATSIAYKSATVPGAKSMTIADRNLLLMPGPLICIMDTTINTDVAGPFQCHLDRDAVSPTNVVLMEKGTKVQGGYTSTVTQGQSRVIAVTANAITPNGVVVPLGGPIADQLGAAGVEGSVDNHWAARLGGALLLSLVDSGFALAQTELQKAGSTNLNISTGSGVSSLASQLLAKTINIPPTITLNQGTTVALWNTGIIDFGPSYRLEMAR